MGHLSILDNTCYYTQAVIDRRYSFLDGDNIRVLFYRYSQSSLNSKLKLFVFLGLKNKILE
jgi:hypothetical protein